MAQIVDCIIYLVDQQLDTSAGFIRVVNDVGKVVKRVRLVLPGAVIHYLSRGVLIHSRLG